MDNSNSNSNNNSDQNNHPDLNHHRRRHHHHHFKSREPLRHHRNLRFHHAQGPVSFLNPTRAHFTFHPSSKRAIPTASAAGGGGDDDDDDDAGQPTQIAQRVRFLWRSRDNRKGRHALQVMKPPPTPSPLVPAPGITVPQRTSHPRQVLRGIKRTVTCFPVWDISWLVAMTFTLGSVVWVLNGFFSWLPVVAPSTEFDGEAKYAGGITAFIGAIVFFEVGSILLVIEAVNANQVGCFGWAVEELFDHPSDDGDGDGDIDGHGDDALQDQHNQNGHDLLNKNNTKRSSSSHPHRFRLRPSNAHCRHHHQNSHNLVGKASKKSRALIAADEDSTAAAASSNKAKSEVQGSGKNSPPISSSASSSSASSSSSTPSWQWIPTLTALRTHYIHDLGYLAGATQLFAATVFGISGITALPGINENLTPQWRLNAAYWIPQVIGGSGFIVSSSLYMLETQRKWYLPAPHMLGWHIAFWNLIGSVGFTLCGALGMAYGNSGAQYQAGLATFWYVLTNSHHPFPGALLTDLT